MLFMWVVVVVWFDACWVFVLIWLVVSVCFVCCVLIVLFMVIIKLLFNYLYVGTINLRFCGFMILVSIVLFECCVVYWLLLYVNCLIC